MSLCSWSSFIDVFRPNSRTYWLSLLSVAVLSLSVVGLGAIQLCKSASASTQKRQVLLSSQPDNYFRSLPERKGDANDISKMKPRVDGITQSFSWECKNKPNRSPNSVIEWAPGIQTHHANIQEVDKITCEPESINITITPSSPGVSC